MIDDFGMWLGGKDAGRFLGYSRDWVEARATAWQAAAVEGRIRYKRNRQNGDRRYYRPDLEAFLD